MRDLLGQRGWGQICVCVHSHMVYICAKTTAQQGVQGASGEPGAGKAAHTQFGLCLPELCAAF